MLRSFACVAVLGLLALFSPASCQAVTPCSGKAVACSAFQDNETVCTSQPLCSWKATAPPGRLCAGIAKPCQLLTDAATCSSARGCQWHAAPAPADATPAAVTTLAASPPPTPAAAAPTGQGNLPYGGMLPLPSATMAAFSIATAVVLLGAFCAGCLQMRRQRRQLRQRPGTAWSQREQSNTADQAMGIPASRPPKLYTAQLTGRNGRGQDGVPIVLGEAEGPGAMDEEVYWLPKPWASAPPRVPSPEEAEEAAPAPLPPSGSVIGDSRIYSGPRRYGWRRHAYPEDPESAAAAVTVAVPTPPPPAARWRRWYLRRQGGAGGDAQAATSEQQQDHAADPTVHRPPVVFAVPALVDGVPSDGASGSVCGGGADGGDAGYSAPDVDAGVGVAAAQTTGDVQLTALRTAEEGMRPLGAAPVAETVAPVSPLRRLRSHRVALSVGGGGSGRGVTVGRDVSVVGDAYVGIEAPEVVCDVEADRDSRERT